MASLATYFYNHIIISIISLVAYLKAVGDAQSRRSCSCDDMFAVSCPLKERGVIGLDRAQLDRHLIRRHQVPHLDAAAQVSEARQTHQVAMRREDALVARACAELVDSLALGVEQRGFGGHRAIDNYELVFGRAPLQRIDGPFLAELHELGVAVGRDLVQGGVAVVGVGRGFGGAQEEEVVA